MFFLSQVRWGDHLRICVFVLFHISNWSTRFAPDKFLFHWPKTTRKYPRLMCALRSDLRIWGGLLSLFLYYLTQYTTSADSEDPYRLELSFFSETKVSKRTFSPFLILDVNSNTLNMNGAALTKEMIIRANHVIDGGQNHNSFQLPFGHPPGNRTTPPVRVNYIFPNIPRWRDNLQVAGVRVKSAPRHLSRLLSIMTNLFTNFQFSSD